MLLARPCSPAPVNSFCIAAISACRVRRRTRMQSRVLTLWAQGEDIVAITRDEDRTVRPAHSDRLRNLLRWSAGPRANMSPDARDGEASAPSRREHPDPGRTSRVRIVHMDRYEVVNLGAMILVVRQAFVHVRAFQIGEAAADLIHRGAVDDEADHIVNTNPAYLPRARAHRGRLVTARCNDDVEGVSMCRPYYRTRLPWMARSRSFGMPPPEQLSKSWRRVRVLRKRS